MYDDDHTVQKSFDTEFLTEYFLQVQWAEFIELKKIITDIFSRKQKPISILDIGRGNARIPKHLCGITEIWDMVERYDGTNNAQNCIDLSKKVISDLEIGNKVTPYLFDATNLDKWEMKYDLIITPWFTAWNFYPENFPFDSYKELGKIMDLSNNEKFVKIFSAAYRLLLSGGEVVIGSCYIDNEATRKKQETFYKKAGMTIITGKNDSFTATREHFWSQRFTQKKLIDYLHFVDTDKISFTLLDTYNFAMLARIRM